jgi:hypothetical protein
MEKLRMVAHAYSGKSKIGSGPGWPDKKGDPISKITRTERTGSMAQAVEHLPSKCKA